MKKALSLVLSLLLCAALLAGCGGTGASGGSSAAAETTLHLAAAASLEKTFVEKLIPMFEEQNPGVKVQGTYDSSGKLQTQIEEGMQTDVFMSAATKQMNELADQNLVDADSVVDLLENEIVLIAPADSDTDIDSFERIGEAETIALGDPESVPVGQYSEEALKNLGVWDSIQNKVSWGTNVTEVLNWVAESSAEVGIVYATDAASTDKVKIIATAPADSLEGPVLYPVGVVSASAQKDLAAKFLTFLQSDEAMEIFIESGFKSNL